jgi:hypothetical protein
VASSHGSETPTAKKSTAKATLKLAVLYQPDSPERREFIDTVIKFHEDKGQPLKGPPMFNQQPLDLFELYNLVKERGGMNEVSSAPAWPRQPVYRKQVQRHLSLDSSFWLII